MIMRERLGAFLSRSVPRLALVCAIGGVSSACSSDTMRFTENPFTNPFAASETTGTVAPQPLKAPVTSVQAQPLGSPVSSAPLPPPSAATPKMAAATPVAPAPLSGAPVAAPKGWTAQGGTPVMLGSNETLATLSNRYGVPEQALRAANNLPAKGQPSPGSRIIIPVYHAVGTAEAAPAAARQTVAQAAPIPAEAPVPAGHRMQLVKGAQPASQGATAAPAKTAAVKPLEPARAVEPAKVAAAKSVPGKPTTVAAVDPKGQPAKAAPATPAPVAKVATAPVAVPAKVAAVEPAKPVSEPAKPVAEAPKPAPAAQVAKAPEAPAAEAADTTGSTGSAAFRWPAKGRIIAGFGGKGGTGNDGINIALPEGTPVKAAEGGTVAYAGNELKGYGNLVLIRHPDGWVSAYAHNGELKVKRGEQVARGQTIATSGQSGNVSSPQLHFELRKGSTPVDPMPHLAGN
jgi:murein DD-endopeptidase MepM/ murein hydrolase activator NlpD